MESLFSIPDLPESSIKIQRVAQTGWIVANLSEGYFIISDYIQEVLKVQKELIIFDEFIALVDLYDRERINYSMKILSAYGILDLNFRVTNGTSQIGVRMKFDGTDFIQNNTRISYGFMQLINKQDDNSSNWQILNTQFKELMYWQSSVPSSLMMMLDDRSYTAVVSDMLRSIVNRFDADKACFYEFDWQAGTQTRICEIMRSEQCSDEKNQMTADAWHFPWLNKNLKATGAVVINNIDELPQEAHVEKEEFASNNIVSIIIVPLNNKNGLWGHIGLAYVDREHRWTDMEIGWFKAIANLASISLEMHFSNKKIRHERKYLRFLQENMPVGLEIYDSNGTLIDENEKAMKMIGFTSKADMLSQKINIFDNTFIPLKKREALRRGEPIYCEIFFVETPFSKNFFKNTEGGPKNIGLTATPLFDDAHNVVNYMTILNDNTQTLKAYMKLDEFERMFKIISEFSEVGFFRANLLDPNVDLYATDQWFDNLNISRAYVKTLSDLIPHTIHPEDAVMMGNFIKDAIENTGSFEQHMEIRVRNADDSISWLRSSVKIVERNVEMNKIIIFGVNIDITEQKTIENALIEAKEEAEESNKLKSAFLSNMSHEIRTPLNAIIGFSSMIAESAENKELREFASLITKNNDLLLQLVSDVLDLSKIEAGSLDLTITSIDANQLCQEIIRIYSLESHGDIEILFDHHLPECNIMCDANRITQIVNNLISNSLKFTKEGSIKIGYYIVRDRKNSMIEFFVEDTGIGMTQDQAQICFDRFVKIDSFVQGIGLGLSICKTLVERMGGVIGVDSELGVGSRFWFRIPLVLANQEDQLSDDLTVYTIDGRKPKLLVAEDLKINYLLISKLLKPYYNITIVENGEEAVIAHLTESPDLILMDLKMPRMNGLEATQAIRRIDKNTPIIAITAFALDFDKEKAISAGCNYLITKPINPIQLRKIIRKFILNGRYEPKNKEELVTA